MNRSLSRNTFLFLSIITAFYTLTSNSGGKSGVSSTGCGGGGCHDMSSNTKLRIDMTPPFNTPITDIDDTVEYTPGGTHEFLVYVQNNGYISITNAKIGFNLSATKGTMVKTDNNTAVNGSEVYHITPRGTSGNGYSNFSFDWIAPNKGAGTVLIHFAGNMVSGSGTSDGDAWNTKTYVLKEKLTKSPIVSNVSSSNITSTSAKINGTVNANSFSTDIEVEYGTSTSYGNTVVPSPSSASGTSNVSTVANVTGLNANTTYHYRIKATNSEGTTYSTDFTFKTSTSTSQIAQVQNDHFNVFHSQDVLTIRRESVENLGKLYLYNTSGKLVVSQEFHPSLREFKIPTHLYSSGIYILKIEDGDQIYTQKIRIF